MFMSKRGNVELLMFLAVALTALGGVVFLLLPNTTTGQAYYQDPAEVPLSSLKMSVLECQNMCFRYPTKSPSYEYPEQVSGQTLSECLAQCRQGASIPSDEGSPLTGNFVIPAAKEYGGGISGVSMPGTKAFPGGRAIELPDQSCYTCSCMSQGITSATREAAEKVCTDNCGGDIVSIVIGQCE